MHKLMIIAGAAAAMVAGPALAHHSGAMFDRSKKVTISGTVANFEYVQPHSWIDVRTMSPDGKVVTWAFEAGAPGQMKMAGVTPDVVKVGDHITVTGYPLRDGRTGGAFIELTLANGKVLKTGRATEVPKAS